MKILSVFIIIAVLFQISLSAIDKNLIATSIPIPTGQVLLNNTFIVKGTVDFGFQEYQLAEKCREQGEDQKSVLTVLNGGYVKNLIIGPNAGNGIVCKGSCTLENVHWRDVCEVNLRSYFS